MWLEVRHPAGRVECGVLLESERPVHWQQVQPCGTLPELRYKTRRKHAYEK